MNTSQLKGIRLTYLTPVGTCRVTKVLDRFDGGDCYEVTRFDGKAWKLQGCMKSYAGAEELASVVSTLSRKA